MNRLEVSPIKPFLSLMMIVTTLFGIVFLQMEERRMGYSLLKLRHQHKQVLDEKRGYEIQLAKVTRPQFLESMAQSRFTLKKISANQIIHLSGEGMQSVRAETRP